MYCGYTQLWWKFQLYQWYRFILLWLQDRLLRWWWNLRRWEVPWIWLGEGWFSGTSDGGVVGVVIRSVERYDVVKIKPTESEAEHWFCLWLRRLRSSGNSIVRVANRSARINQWQCSIPGLAIGWVFRFSAYDSDIRFSLGHKLSHDSDSDSVASENQP